MYPSFIFQERQVSSHLHLASADFEQPCAHIEFDINMLGDCDTIVAELCRRAGWDLQHELIVKDDIVDVKLQEGYESQFSFTIVKA